MLMLPLGLVDSMVLAVPGVADHEWCDVIALLAFSMEVEWSVICLGSQCAALQHGVGSSACRVAKEGSCNVRNVELGLCGADGSCHAVTIVGCGGWPFGCCCSIEAVSTLAVGLAGGPGRMFRGPVFRQFCCGSGMMLALVQQCSGFVWGGLLAVILSTFYAATAQIDLGCVLWLNLHFLLLVLLCLESAMDVVHGLET
ncbi:hypothetical protein Nepgr_022918 [Nepenthes gracilis]|uniref:Secreted protein n=1 Tax=Nepenthes gracilis TaxID=150966 RepID=A0AAD3XYV6_NEPGR|nr:hypothetical protein Nepgr_022918 [Nepenthes gracilis]